MSPDLDAPSVAFAWLYTAWGGAEVQLLHLARHAPDGTDITVIAPRSTDGTLRALWSEIPHRWVDVDHHITVTDEVLTDRGRGTLFNRVARRTRRAADTFRAGLEFRRAARTLPADVVVHVDIPPWSAVVALAAVARTRPVVLTWHTPMPQPGGWRERIVTAKLKFLARMPGFAVFAASEPARLDAMRVFGLDRSAIPVVPAGFDPEEIASVEADEQPDLVVGTGAVVERKAVDVAVEAVRRLHDRGRPVRMIWLGDGDRRAAVEQRVEALGLGSSVEIRPASHASTHRIDLLQTVAQAAVYVQPSRLDGLPVAVLEAMALGRPVVATNVGAMAELDDDTGVTWIPVDDPDALADALAELLADPERRRAIGRRGRAAVGERYDMRRAAPAAFAHYAHILTAMRPTPPRRSS